MLRLARQLEFGNYEDFRTGFQAQLVETGFGARAGALFSGDKTGAGQTLEDKILAANQQNLLSTFSPGNLRDISKVATLLRNAPTIYLIGSGAGFWLASIMKSTGSMILPNLRVVGAEYAVAAEDLAELCPDDVVLCFGLNPCALRTVEAIHFAREHGACTIAMTDRPSSPLVEFADFILYAETQGPHYYPSVAVMVILIETLLAKVVAEGSDYEIERIKVFEAHRKASSGYIEY